MATLRGQGAFKGVNLIVHAPAKSVVPDKDKDGAIKGRYLDVQVDQSLKNADKVKDGKSPADSNPHLASYSKDHPNGGTYVDHRIYYSESQYQKMVEAAGKKAATLENGDTVLGITADVRKNAQGQLIVATDKDMTATKNPHFGKTVLDKQAAVTAAAKEHRTAVREAQAEAPAQAQAEAQNEAETPFTEAEGPEVG